MSKTLYRIATALIIIWIAAYFVTRGNNYVHFILALALVVLFFSERVRFRTENEIE